VHGSRWPQLCIKEKGKLHLSLTHNHLFPIIPGEESVLIRQKTVERPASEKLVENGQMQGFRNRGPALRVGSPSEARTNPEE
jgi:hypothetical protein